VQSPHIGRFDRGEWSCKANAAGRLFRTYATIPGIAWGIDGETNSNTRPAKAGRGNWKIILIQKLVAPDQKPRKVKLSELVEELISHGINPSRGMTTIRDKMGHSSSKARHHEYLR
jgi:hypothetical protein